MFEIKQATIHDTELILKYIKELAIAENLPYEVTVSKEDIEQNIFNKDSTVGALICYNEQIPCGFAVYYYTFSTSTGKKGLHLDDLYIEPSHQGKGYGKNVLAYLSKFAVKSNCSRFEWWALKTNVSAIKFYENIGARKVDEIFIFRLDSEGINAMAENEITQ